MKKYKLSHKCRIYPKQYQIDKFNRTIELKEEVYQKLRTDYIEDKRKSIKEKKRKKFNKEYFFKKLQKLKKENPELNTIDKTILIKTYHSIIKEINFTNGNLKEEKERKELFEIKADRNIKVISERLYLPDYGEFKLHYGKQTFGQLDNIRITKENNKWYAIITSTYYTKITYPKTGKAIGIDLGLKTLITLSDGTKIHPRNLTKQEEKIKYYYRELSKENKGSIKHEQKKEKLKKAETKLKNIINDIFHKVTTDLVKKYDIIALEKLNIKEMMQDPRFSKKIHKARWNKLVEMLKYKCFIFDKTFIQVDQYYPSSKLCSNCGYKKKDLTIDIREWTCPQCNTKHDRDINAAKNILKKAKESL